MTRADFDLGASEHRPVQQQLGNDLSTMSDDELASHRAEHRAAGNWDGWNQANAEFRRRQI